MIPHLMFVDDEEDVLESFVPGFLSDLSRRLSQSEAFQAANEQAGGLFPSGRINFALNAVGYESSKAAAYQYRTPIHFRVHLVCEKGGSFRHALRLLKDHFFAVVVSDLRFSSDELGSRAGRLLIEDIQRRNLETLGILYSAYQKPDGFPSEQFVRKGGSEDLGVGKLLDTIHDGIVRFLKSPSIARIGRELTKRGLVYQSDSFGTTLKRIFDYAQVYLGPEAPAEPGRRRPRPTLLLDGETGTGKTELAGLVHQLSDRRDAPLVYATCSQLTDENLLRSSLFGHVKGSYSGATSDRAGLVKSAAKGMLLLDDLHKLNEGTSIILHSFLDDGFYSHVGEDEVRRQAESAVLVTVETPRWEEIKAKELLSPSFINRVEQLIVKIPPLRARPEDIEHQAKYYARAHAKQLGLEMDLAPDLLQWLRQHGFPNGNSRRLRDFIKGVVSSQARSTDMLTLADAVEYAREIGLPIENDSASSNRSTTPAPVTTTPSSNTPVSRVTPRAGADDDEPELTGWRQRMRILATKAIMQDCSKSKLDAEAECKRLFEELFPVHWESFRQICTSLDPKHPVEMKLFEELFRYFAVSVFGNPVKAAKELGMKDNALREFIYSRESRRQQEGE